MVANESKDEIIDNHSTDLEKEPKRGKEEESDSETRRDSVSSQGDSQTADDEKVEKAPKVPKKIVKKNSSDNHSHASRMRADRETHKSQSKSLHNTPKKSPKPNKGHSKMTTKNSTSTISKNMKVPPKPSSESSEGIDDKPIEELKEVDLVDGASNGAQSVGSDDETVDAEEDGEHEDKAALEQRNEHEDKAAFDQRNEHEDKAALDQRNEHEDKAALDQMNDHEEGKAALDQRIEEMEMRIEKLEEELREVAALEISLYSVAPEHGSSAHKVHTPARRLSRLYIHASKHWTQNKRATIAKNTVSGLVLIAKSCGNDVPRLTFWLSNTIVLREIISQAFCNSIHSSPVVRFSESNGSVKKSDGKSSTLKWKGSSGGKQVNKPGFLQFIDDWQETRTFTSALEKVESWIFSRIVESVWWQTLTPHMQPPVKVSCTNKTIECLVGPALGDQQQGSFSINLWKNAFQDAFQRLCPVRAGGHECGCLPVIARMVMEQCVARLDVAMFNAILRESAYEIPTDPISDPIVDSRVLPIPAGDLSFGSGAQLKNSVGTWSRWLTDLFGMDADDCMTEVQINGEDGEIKGGNDEPKSFHLLNALSDLLMLPKDMLMDRSIRKEVCPSISLPLLKRILCNFTPDEFCPDPVTGAVLEAVNAESIVERRLSGDSFSSFPYPATPVLYAPPSSADVAEKVAEAGGKSQLARNASMVQKKGYTSDEELEELDSPLTSIIEKMPPSPSVARNGNGKHSEATGLNGLNARYELLREVWSS